MPAGALTPLPLSAPAASLVLCRYEGLTRDAIAHGMGVMTFGEGTGGGFHLREVRRGDK